jgi:hypothetical protein
MRRPATSLAAAAASLLAVTSSLVLVTGCSSKKSPETTVAASNSDAAGADSAASPSSTASLDSLSSTDSTVPTSTDTADRADTVTDSTELVPSSAVGEPNPATPADTGAEPSPDSSETTLLTGAADLTDEQLTSAFTAMGIPVATDRLTCVKQKAGKTDMSAPEPPPEFLRALMSCVPKSLVEANGDKLAASATKSGVTIDKARCFQEKTFETMAATDIAAFTKLLDANAPVDFPADIKATLKENTKVCVLTDAQFSSLLEG